MATAADRTSLPSHGVCILDLARPLPVRYATHVRADFGADVIKVDEPMPQEARA